MPPKKQRGQKIDTSKLFNENKEETFDWAAGHNYDEDKAQEDQARKAKSPTDDRNRVAITKAASFGNFRDEGQMTAGVPNDMEAPFVAFVKTFGRSVNEEVMKSYFPNMEINHVLIINNDKALFAFVEFDSREDLANALLVTGAKMMYQHPCTVDVAAPEQIQKYQNSMSKRQPRSMHGRSPTSPKVDFDRDNVFGSTSAPDVDIDELAAEDSGNASGRGGRGGRGGGFRGMSKSGSANFDAGRDSIFGSAEPVPNTTGGDNGEEGMSKRPGRFAGGKIGVSSASAQFGEISRDSVFGSASATASPNPTGRPQFGRNASKDSFESDQQSDKSAPKEAPAFSRDIFGKAEVPAARTTPDENNKDENGENAEDGSNNKRGPRSPNSRSPRSNNNNTNITGRDGFFGSRESGKNTSDSNGNSGRRKEGGGNNNNGGFSRRSPTTQKESDVGDRFGNLRNDKPQQQQQQAPPPPPVVKDSTGAGSSKPSYASLASGGGNWRS